MTTAVIYRAPHLRQLIPSDPYGWANCSAVGLARATNAATLGGLRISGREVRALSSEPIPDPRSPGLNIPQLVAVSRKLRVPIVDRTGGTWDDIVTVLDNEGPGRRVLAQIDYATLGALRCQKGGDFGHLLTLDAVRRRDGALQVLASDSLCSAVRWYPIAPVRAAMARLALDSGLTGGRLRWAVTREIPLIAGGAP